MGEGQERPCLDIGLIVDLGVETGELFQIHQAQGDGRPVRFIVGLSCESAGRDVETSVGGAESAHKRADERCADGGVAPMLDLNDDVGRFESKREGRRS